MGKIMLNGISYGSLTSSPHMIKHGDLSLYQALKFLENKIIIGSGTPNASMGRDGDLYISYDDEPPKITVIAPESATTYAVSDNSINYTVSGVIDKVESIESIKVNGKSANINGNNWSYTLTNLATNTHHTITVTAKNKTGKETSISRVLVINTHYRDAIAQVGGNAYNYSSLDQVLKDSTICAKLANNSIAYNEMKTYYSDSMTNYIDSNFSAGLSLLNYKCGLKCAIFNNGVFMEGVNFVRGAYWGVDKNNKNVEVTKGSNYYHIHASTTSDRGANAWMQTSIPIDLTAYQSIKSKLKYGGKSTYNVMAFGYGDSLTTGSNQDIWNQYYGTDVSNTFTNTSETTVTSTLNCSSVKTTKTIGYFDSIASASAGYIYVYDLWLIPASGDTPAIDPSLVYENGVLYDTNVKTTGKYLTTNWNNNGKLTLTTYDSAWGGHWYIYGFTKPANYTTLNILVSGLTANDTRPWIRIYAQDSLNTSTESINHNGNYSSTEVKPGNSNITLTLNKNAGNQLVCYGGVYNATQSTTTISKIWWS